MKTQRIPTNFRMSDDYKRKFVFLGKSVRIEIEAAPPGEILIKQIAISDEPFDSDAGNSLDWIHESVERMRAESEELFGANVFPEAVPAPTNSKVLRCWNEFWTAGAVWEKHGMEWVCTDAAPIIRWMLKMNPAAAKLELARRGCQWEWL